jgi:hypothetical protein
LPTPNAAPQGVKKTKLGLREFVKLGDFLQRIDTEAHTAVRARAPQPRPARGRERAVCGLGLLPCLFVKPAAPATVPPLLTRCTRVHHPPLPPRQSNEVTFSVAGISKFGGQLSITAAYAPSPPPHDGARVDITFQRALLTPEALEALFKANYDLLLGIFNPEGWLEVTYLDDELRVGRDDKGNVFVVERC